MSDPFGYGYAVSHFGDPFLVMVIRSITPNHRLWYHYWVIYFFIICFGYIWIIFI